MHPAACRVDSPHFPFVQQPELLALPQHRSWTSEGGSPSPAGHAHDSWDCCPCRTWRTMSGQKSLQRMLPTQAARTLWPPVCMIVSESHVRIPRSSGVLPPAVSSCAWRIPQLRQGLLLTGVSTRSSTCCCRVSWKRSGYRQLSTLQYAVAADAVMCLHRRTRAVESAWHSEEQHIICHAPRTNGSRHVSSRRPVVARIPVLLHTAVSHVNAAATHATTDS